MTLPSASEQVKFLTDIQALLEDGLFVATYKFALLTAIADISIESNVHDDQELHVSLNRIAEKFIEYYWQQSLPFPSQSGNRILIQSTGRQAAAISKLSIHSEATTLAEIRRDSQEWNKLVNRISKIIKGMPLFKLQTIGGKPRPFLYDNELIDNGIKLKRGIAYHLRQFHALVTGLARGRWITAIRANPHNQSALGTSQDLDYFLFGSEREPIAQHGSLLVDVQQGCCLYCDRRLTKKEIHVDHFIPWSLYHLNLVPNLVASHPQCNLAKRDFLAGGTHIAGWIARNRDNRNALADVCGNTYEIQLNATNNVALWAYTRAMQLQQQVWISGKQLSTLQISDIVALQN